MAPTHRLRRSCLVVALALATACSRREPAAGTAADSLTAQAIAGDRGVRLSMPLAPAGAGRVTLRAVAEARADLGAREPAAIAPAPVTSELPPPDAEPGEVPEPAVSPESVTLTLKPPIARGALLLPSGGRGGRVVLDVRVDESGEVSDVEWVEGDADSATVRAATSAAFAMRYHPALLGLRPVAVWTRLSFDVRRQR